METSNRAAKPPLFPWKPQLRLEASDVTNHEGRTSATRQRSTPRDPERLFASRLRGLSRTLSTAPRTVLEREHLGSPELNRMFLGCNCLARRLHLVIDMRRGTASRVRSERNTTMMKLNQTSSVNVLEEAQLGQVVGGHRGGHRGRKYNHCYEKRRYNDCYDYNYEGKGYDCSYEYDNDYCYEDSYDYCDRRYS